MQKRTIGTLLCLLGVAAFALSAPLTKLALGGYQPAEIGLGRLVIAGSGASLYLIVRRFTDGAVRILPARDELVAYGFVIAGVIFGFPLLFSFAMQELGAAYGSVALGLLPLFTAIYAVKTAGESMNPRFWFAAAAGSLIVLIHGGISAVDAHGASLRGVAVLFAAIAIGAGGYAYGGRLSRLNGGRGADVISRALVLALPIALPCFLIFSRHNLAEVMGTAPGTETAAFLYLGLVSQWLGFFAWYSGLARAGIAVGAQTQLLQPFLSLGFVAWIFQAEAIQIADVLTAVAVVGCIVLARRAK